MDWPTIACHVDAEELLVTYAPEVPADVARAIIKDLFATGRVPPKTPEGRGALAVSVVRRVWTGTQHGPAGIHLVALVGDRCLVSRAIPADGRPDGSPAIA